MKFADIDPRSNLPIITETRSLGKWRALPRYYAQDVLHAIEADSTGPWLTTYLAYDGPNIEGVQCWKCGRELMGYKPVLRAVSYNEKRQIFEGQPLEKQGREVVALRYHNHYREGRFRIMRGDVEGYFTFLHCASCEIRDEDGEKLLAIFLAGREAAYEKLRSQVALSKDDDNGMALYMYQYCPEVANLDRITDRWTLQDLQGLGQRGEM